MSQESRYINKRKRQALALSCKFLLMRIFPIKKTRIVFSTFEGDGGFCCNPRYIAEEFYRQHPDWDMVWLTRKEQSEFPDYITVKKYTDWNIAYYLSTSKVWIDNYRKPYGTLKRKRQLYIQTWHASIGFKAVGLYRGDKFPEIARIISEADSRLIDYVLSNSEYCNRIYPKKLLYNGTTLMTGSPRVDCIIKKNPDNIRSVRTRLAIEDSIRLVMFAPTFRGGNQKRKKQVLSDIPSVDFDRLIKNLNKQFGGEWNVLLRLHPQLSAKLEKMPIDNEDKRLIDVSQEPDISELIMCCDMLLTDYSSCAFDAAFAKIPVLLYADDIQEYVDNRGEFMWRRDELPFLIAENNDELEKNIETFNQEKYNIRVNKFVDEYKVFEDGSACNYVVDKIDSIIMREGFIF